MIVGQERILERIDAWVTARRPRNLLLRGGPGRGKTLIAKDYARRVAARHYYYEVCSSRSNTLTPPTDGEPVIIDEIHLLSNETDWYDFTVLIGCTTEGSPISEPLRSRMVEVWLEPYTIEQLVDVGLLHVDLPRDVARVAATRCRGNPRQVVSLCEELFIWRRAGSILTPQEVLDRAGFYEGGFTDTDRAYLEFLQRSQPASASTIARTLSLPLLHVTEEIEPFLLQQGLIRITSKGREIVYVENSAN